MLLPLPVLPTKPTLGDSTLAENIAFGVPHDAIDIDRVQQAARQAQIADFIESSPEGYQAFVGERGIRLSGGQRQRIGIAKAEAEGKYKGRKPKARDKELDIQRMTAEGMKPKAIAEALGISVPSVYKYRKAA